MPQTARRIAVCCAILVVVVRSNSAPKSLHAQEIHEAPFWRAASGRQMQICVVNVHLGILPTRLPLASSTGRSSAGYCSAAPGFAVPGDSLSSGEGSPWDNGCAASESPGRTRCRGAHVLPYHHDVPTPGVPLGRGALQSPFRPACRSFLTPQRLGGSRMGRAHPVCGSAGVVYAIGRSARAHTSPARRHRPCQPISLAHPGIGGLALAPLTAVLTSSNQPCLTRGSIS
jgi:hypothetical protein